MSYIHLIQGWQENKDGTTALALNAIYVAASYTLRMILVPHIGTEND